ncbi:MAG: hypothetical protein ACQEP8_01355 [Chlamydiota bacterium]
MVNLASTLFLISLSLATVALVVGLFWGARWMVKRPGGVSPYGGGQMLRGTELSMAAIKKIDHYLTRFESDANPNLEFSKAAVCKKTGRVFPNATTFWGIIIVGRNFLARRYPGDYKAWETLTVDEQEDIRKSHDTFDDYNLDYPDTEKPGPLYVDMKTKTLLGWQCVPDTVLEVMIVQKSQNRNDR